MSDLNQAPKLNPAQQALTDELGAVPAERPRFRDDLRDHLRHELEDALDPILAEIKEPPLFVSKRDLALIHGCEARFVAEQDVEFAWTVAMARGSVAHKAIELSITWRGTPTPLDLVEGAMARLEHDDRSVGAFLRTLDEPQRAELAGMANDFVATFLETFPPLRRQWRPVAESRVRAELCEGRLALAGRVDLSLGQPDGAIAGKVLFDVKTGRPSPGHREDLRFYALLETLKSGVPPRLLVNYYLEAGDAHDETVSEDTLWTAAQRVVDAVEKTIALTGPGPRRPNTSPGGGCRWCPALSRCDEGHRFLSRSDDDEDLPAV
jgi:hypothetical protein